jgi:hypothetical protein
MHVLVVDPSMTHDPRSFFTKFDQFDAVMVFESIVDDIALPSCSCFRGFFVDVEAALPR